MIMIQYWAPIIIHMRSFLLNFVVRMCNIMCNKPGWGFALRYIYTCIIVYPKTPKPFPVLTLESINQLKETWLILRNED